MDKPAKTDHRVSFATIVAAIGLAFASQSALAQSGGDYAILRSTIHPGSTACTSSGGGIYQIRATIGQPAADLLSAGAYELASGFLSKATPAFAPPAEEPGEWVKNRFLSFVVPTDAAGEPFAIRVLLTSLHHPPAPPDAPDFSAFEGQYRYVNLFRDGDGDPIFDCADTPAGASYQCAMLGCEPEYRDWATEIGGGLLHVTSAAVVPSSEYEIDFVRASCTEANTACCPASAGLHLTTGLWGDVVPGQLNVLDIAATVDKLQEDPDAPAEPSIMLHPNELPPHTDNVNVIEISYVTDALKGSAYPFAGPASCE